MLWIVSIRLLIFSQLSLTSSRSNAVDTQLSRIVLQSSLVCRSSLGPRLCITNTEPSEGLMSWLLSSVKWRRHGSSRRLTVEFAGSSSLRGSWTWSLSRADSSCTGEWTRYRGDFLPTPRDERHCARICLSHAYSASSYWASSIVRHNYSSSPQSVAYCLYQCGHTSTINIESYRMPWALTQYRSRSLYILK